MTPTPILDLDDISISYSGVARAVSSVSLRVMPGEVVGLIGESGSGKSTLAHSILGLLPASASVEGRHMRLNGQDLLAASANARRHLRGPGAAMVFQNPMATFSPLHRIGRQLMDFLWRDRASSPDEKRRRIIHALADAGISDPEARFDAYPFELSGGMLQRISIAAALLMQPALLIADEPTTALDVTMEAQILHLMRELRQRTGVSILMISHQLGVIAEICDRVAVMYAGRIVEEGPVERIFADPRHGYTKALLSCELSLVEDGAARLPAISWRDEPGEVRP
ncbi:ABC transporter ATP-binding protein [Rhizobium alvei]|uniref:ABC transporter ATP-binding protein n=1 Tax=Rhizobium alvei TaxID=1132659 RepID=A0ABT8YRI3_9HYPH|nr:ABC transporter ATP-binding protein [Rhizobium alvei]MDO6966346.1 ABC transporter ATP-binding protein [Rhizobium alvei]